MIALTIQNPIPEITIHDGKAVTTSIAVSEYFHKRHDDVLKKIRAIITDCKPEWCLRNFAEASREVVQPNGGIATYKCFELTRDAFVLIVMGFTGKKALQWKIDYINAFNQMEVELQRLAAPSPIHPTDYDTRTLCYKRAGITINELTLREDEIVITLESWLQLAQKNGWVVIRRDQLAGRLTSMIEQCLLVH
ncbi:Rha family transcriptional regulator [Serratia nevei]|nr:Rha family transcriptional regulator [Serratia nevei]MBX9336079.1 Rha family transcriptional regulator [Serratia marcescens]MDR8480038.1 Rha family transcriptional regulator [Serratia nevei]WMC77443.1 Rha family transcriptional regulator [Serratia nevei]WMC78655.1 Rha family transcriptional regulator [Serratia nevei]